MPIYYNPNPPPAKGTEAYEDYGTKHDQELRDEIIGTVIVQNIMMPIGPCCASPTGCPLNMSIDLKPEYADTIDDDEKMMLALFSQVAVPLTQALLVVQVPWRPSVATVIARPHLMPTPSRCRARTSRSRPCE